MGPPNRPVTDVTPTGGSTSIATELSPSTLEALAQHVADLMVAAGDAKVPPGWVSAAKVAEHLDCDVEWVLSNRRVLGGAPMGEGSRPRYRFELAHVDAVMRARRELQAQAIKEPSARRRRRRPKPGTERTLRARPSVLPMG